MMILTVFSFDENSPKFTNDFKISKIFYQRIFQSSTSTIANHLNHLRISFIVKYFFFVSFWPDFLLNVILMFRFSMNLFSFLRFRQLTIFSVCLIRFSIIFHIFSYFSHIFSLEKILLAFPILYLDFHSNFMHFTSI